MACMEVTRARARISPSGSACEKLDTEQRLAAHALQADVTEVDAADEQAEA
jgi:hypothetical protein